MDRMSNIAVKPKLIESKFGTSEKYFNMSDGFKNAFANDTKD